MSGSRTTICTPCQMSCADPGGDPYLRKLPRYGSFVKSAVGKHQAFDRHLAELGSIARAICTRLPLMERTSHPTPYILICAPSWVRSSTSLNGSDQSLPDVWNITRASWAG